MYVCMYLCIHTHTHTYTHTLMADSRCKAKTNTTLQCNYPLIKAKKKTKQNSDVYQLLILRLQSICVCLGINRI